MRFSKLIVLLIALNFPVIHAAILGNIGPTYPIGEESALDMIMKKLLSKEKSGEIKQLQEEIIRRSMGNIKHMKPVDGITTVQHRSQRFIDPTVTYAKAITLEDGRIVVPAGTKINPLDMISLTKTLVFFDGRDPEQKEAVGRLVAKGDRIKVKQILVAGSWLDLTKTWKTQVFYDQEGRLSRRFGITAVPAVIRQQGKRLVLDEIPAKEFK